MKYLLTLFALFTIYICGCGNDSTTNSSNNGNGETVIYSLDSLSITLNTNVGIIDSELVVTNCPNIKIVFNCSTNSDSVLSFALYQIRAMDSSGIYKDTINNHISTLNNDHTILVNGSNNYFLNLFLQVNGNSPYFLRLRNIRVIKI
jgi:hypothetical protein